MLLAEELVIKVEPYWNVNCVNHDGSLGVEGIKVEPYWNVNLSISSCIALLKELK